MNLPEEDIDWGEVNEFLDGEELRRLLDELLDDSAIWDDWDEMPQDDYEIEEGDCA